MSRSPLELAHAIVDTLDQKKGDDILLLDIAEVCSFTDLFVMCNGRSERTLKALSEAVSEELKEKFEVRADRIEGDPASGWILLDYGDVIVHLFSPQLRDYYALEQLWGEGQVVLRIA